MSARQMGCSTCAIRHRAICGALSDKEIVHLNAIARWKQLSPGQVVFRDHEEPQYFANIVSGVVKLTKTLADGREQIVALQFPSDFLGQPFRRYSPYFAEAATGVVLCTFDRSRFERLTQDYPGLEHRLFLHALDELDAAREWMVLLGRKSAGEKLASFLLMIANRYSGTGCASPAASNSARFELALSRGEIADYLGLTIETVSRQITALRRRGIVVLGSTRSVFVPNLARLATAAEEDFD
ncbi:MAG: Crp/Fnr family transcriptional regulator [Hyphomicrobiaceae bacterium]